MVAVSPSVESKRRSTGELACLNSVVSARSSSNSGRFVIDTRKPEPAKSSVQIVPSAAARRHAVSWTGMGAEVVQISRCDKVELFFCGQRHLLVFYEQGSRNGGETTVGDMPRLMLRNLQHKFTFVPAGYEFREWHDLRVMARVVFIYIEPALVPIASQVGDPPFLPRLFVENAALRESAAKLSSTVECGFESDASYLTAIGAVLLHELVKFNQGGGIHQSPMLSGLTKRQRRVVTDYMEEHLEEVISLAKLADLAHLSRYYFCRAFKASFGVPPHRYLLNRRIERAKRLLVSTERSMTDIGWSVGFQEPSSFTAAFRRVTGLTPTAYRRRFS